MARSEAVKRASTVTVCPSTDAAGCSGSTTWNTGWISFADLNANGAVDAGETILQVAPAPAGTLALTSTSFTAVRYNASGMLMGPAGTFRLEKSGCTGDKAREISIAITERVSTTRVNCTT
jgi:type IV fimbrial biogenesis protein FimT